MSILFVGTGTNLKTGKPIVFRIHDRFGSRDPKKSIGLLNANLMIDTLTDAATGKIVEGPHQNKIQDIEIAIEFESMKRKGLLVGGEALDLSGKLFAVASANLKLKRQGYAGGLQFDARKASEDTRDAFVRRCIVSIVMPFLEFCKLNGEKISPELEMALLSRGAATEPHLKQEYTELYGRYCEWRRNPRK